MANFLQDMVTFIAASTAVTQHTTTGGIHYNKTPQFSGRPFVWMRMGSDTEGLELDGSGGLHEAIMDLECVAENESDSQDVSDAIKTLLNGHRGSVGSHTAKIFVSDKDDDYLPKSIDSDSGRHVVAFDVRAFYTS